jgi:hypothetical protein
MTRPVDDLLSRHRSGEFLRHLHKRGQFLAKKKPRRVAVGDLVERMLTGVGISKERVQQWLRVKDCGCAKRQRWLNQWGYTQQDRIERLLNRAARWYGIG